MATTYILISSNTLTSSAASVTFSSIPSTYTDLVLKVSARSSASANASALQIQINSITGSISETTLYGYNNTAYTSRDTGLNAFGASSYLEVPAASATSSTFNNYEAYIPNYAGSTYKPINSFGVMENNSATIYYVTTAAHLLNNTAAITSLTLTMITSPNFVSGSSFYLYGIKNS